MVLTCLRPFWNCSQYRSPNKRIGLLNLRSTSREKRYRKKMLCEGNGQGSRQFIFIFILHVNEFMIWCKLAGHILWLTNFCTTSVFFIWSQCLGFLDCCHFMCTLCAYNLDSQFSSSYFSFSEKPFSQLKSINMAEWYSWRKRGLLWEDWGML